MPTLQKNIDNVSSERIAKKILSLLQITWRTEQLFKCGMLNTLGQPNAKYIFNVKSK